MLWGDRTLNIEGTMIFEDAQNGLKAAIFFKHNKFDRFIGKIYNYAPQKQLQTKEPTKMSDIKDIQKEICEISGSWLQNISIGNKDYWQIDTIYPLQPIPAPNTLPSDQRYREDLIWLKRDNEFFAQTWKTRYTKFISLILDIFDRLEIQQRHERKLRLDKNKPPVNNKK